MLYAFEDQSRVAALAPDFRALAAASPVAVIATAPGDEVDFVSRFFAPQLGVDEDPVTGSAHCALAPYWADRLGTDRLRARQPDGEAVSFTADGFHARVIQHECDHLFGIVYPDRMRSMESLTFVREHERYGS